MPLLTTVATTALLATLGTILYSQVRGAYHEQLITDIKEQVEHSVPARCHRVVIVEPSHGDGIWSASVYWTVDEEENVSQAFATTETEVLIRLKRNLRRACRVANADGGLKGEF